MMRLLARIVGGVSGFSVTETATVMAGLSLLTATAAPNLQEYLDVARLTKAHGDVRVIAVSIFRLVLDVKTVTSLSNGRGIELLVGPGRVPEARLPDTAAWRDQVDESRVQNLAAHLVTNAAGYPVVGSDRRWRGPYLEGLSSDPWGCRYAANIGHFRRRDGLVTIVLSAGPNCMVETSFRMTGLSVGGDDVAGLIGAGH